MPKQKKPTAPRAPATQAGYRKPMPEVVDPRWLLKAGALMIAVCLLCAYVAICVLFYKTQWQLVLHPTRTATHKPADYNLQAEEITQANGLHLWLIPGDQASDPTVLMFPSGDGNASDSLERAAAFHNAHLSVMLFDYRGYGASAERHPTQAMMEADSENALSFIQGMNGVSAGQLLVYGKGVGASLATRLCAEHSQITALILESATGDLTEAAAQDSRSRLVPFHLLFHENFPLAQPLQHLKTPKLLITYPGSLNLRTAADPKMLVGLPSPSDEADFTTALHRFLDSYVTYPATSVLSVGD